MKSSHFRILTSIAFLTATPAFAQMDPQAIIARHVAEGAHVSRGSMGTIITPASSVRGPVDDGSRMYTNTKILVPDVPMGPHNANAPNTNAPPFSGYYYANTPSSLACVYGLVAVAQGCHPDLFHTNATGGSRAVGIVDAYNGMNVRADLQHYATQFGLPAITATNLVIYYCTGTTAATCATGNAPTAYDSGWEGEISLDVQMVHAMAPSAKIFLVLAKDNQNASLLAASDKAAALVAAANGGEVSMSFGHHEISGDSASDPHYVKAKVVFFASTGDDIIPGYPAASPNVVAVGGTTVSRTPANGKFFGEASWTEAGAGPSAFIARPSYQPASVGAKRALPDVAAVANPDTGVWVYISAQGGWFVFGGTSAASPVMAAIVNNAGSFKGSTAAQQTLMYSALGKAADWYDVKQGTCGAQQGYWAKAGLDFCGGIGAPRGLAGK